VRFCSIDLFADRQTPTNCQTVTKAMNSQVQMIVKNISTGW
jgi:hypothetical protein